MLLAYAQSPAEVSLISVAVTEQLSAEEETTVDDNKVTLDPVKSNDWSEAVTVGAVTSATVKLSEEAVLRLPAASCTLKYSVLLPTSEQPKLMVPA